MTTKPPMPDWLRQLLIDQGKLGLDGATRAAHATRCPRCRNPIMIGLDHDRCAMTARCDPQPLNTLGEYQALMADRASYSLTWRGSRYELDHRGPEQIQAHPAGHKNNFFDVLAEHRCDSPQLPTAQSRITTPRHYQETDPCPF